jgi:hypothetical protein
MSSEKGSREQIDARHIEASIESNKAVRENIPGFTDNDRLGYQAGIGYLYKKDGKYGFEADSGEPDEPIVELVSVPDDASLTQEELDGLQEVVRVSNAALSVGDVQGKPSLVCTEQWDSQVRKIEFRTTDGWTEERQPVEVAPQE